MTFTHLEVHSHFTLLGATPPVPALVARARGDGMTHLALTDTNALYGAVAFARACREAEIRPIIGMTVTVAEPTPPAPLPTEEGGDKLPSPRRGGVGERSGKRPVSSFCLPKIPSGYRSLCRLSSLIQGSPEREALAARGIGWDELAAHREGLVCLSGGRNGWIERYVRGGEVAAAQLCAGRLAGIFEEDAVLAMELHKPGDEAVAAEVLALGRRLGLPTVAVQPVYCLAPEDAPRLRLLASIRANVRFEDAAGVAVSGSAAEDAAHEDAREVHMPGSAPQQLGTAEAAPTPPGRRAWIPGPLSPGKESHNPLRITAGATGNRLASPGEERRLHWLAPAEVATRFARFPQAVAMTAEIAARCGECLPDGRPIWPALKLPAGQTPDEALAALAHAGLTAKFPTSNLQPPTSNFQPPTSNLQLPTSNLQRLSTELTAITTHGYAPLFLVVADIVRHARENDIPVSTRGSVANSLVAYCTGITTVDPIEHGLLFERFLNPARANPPDIDLDFCSRRRDEVLRYVRETYGPERVALIGTVSTMQPQSAVRETGKAYGLPAGQIDRLVGMLPHRWHPDPRRRDRRTADDVLAALDDPLEREVVRLAYALVGQPDHLSVHPGGVVIAPGPLTDVLPVQWAPKGFLITQFEHADVEALGLPKMDLLGIRALTVLADTAEWVRRDRDPAFRLAGIPLDDPATAGLIARGETIGVFQCESDGAQRTLRKLKARTVADLAIANAFFKPGPAMGGMAAAFVRRYRGEEPVAYLHPALSPILGPTKGVLIFQEQILRLAREIAGLTWAQADQLRRGMSHFGADQMTAIREQFVAGCRRPPPAGPAFTLAQANTLWEQVMPFAGYGFNQGHATAYADVSFRSAYLKAHYPAEFLCARLADYGGFHHPAVYIAEAVRLGIGVRPPHVNFSGEAFTLANQRISESTNQRISESANQENDADSPSADSPFADSPFADSPFADSPFADSPFADSPFADSPFADSPSAILYMGLGQVRDLRQSAVAAILRERDRGPFTGLRDLLRRVELRPKEIDHLIRCGALDGLAESRAALLAEAGQVRHAGAGQMTFEFAGPEVPAETLRQRWDWEAELLGLPVSAFADPLALVRDRLPAHGSLAELPDSRGRPVTVAGVRLPGWTGGQGFFLSDGTMFVIVKGDKAAKSPAAWQPLSVRGRWIGDGWGTFWLQADQMAPIEA